MNCFENFRMYMYISQISGCQPFEMDLKFFKINDYKGYRRPSFTFEASVKEGATGITLNATKVDMTVHKNNVELTFKGTPDIFKPALPFEAWVSYLFAPIESDIFMHQASFEHLSETME